MGGLDFRWAPAIVLVTTAMRWEEFVDRVRAARGWSRGVPLPRRPRVDVVARHCDVALRLFRERHEQLRDELAGTGDFAAPAATPIAADAVLR